MKKLTIRQLVLNALPNKESNSLNIEQIHVEIEKQSNRKINFNSLQSVISMLVNEDNPVVCDIWHRRKTLRVCNWSSGRDNAKISFDLPFGSSSHSTYFKGKPKRGLGSKLYSN